MQSLPAGLHSEYQRWKRRVREAAPEYPPDPECLTWEEVLHAHFLICDHFGREGEEVFTPGPRDEGRLLRAVGRQHVAFGSARKWNDVYQKAATLFFGIAKSNHVFHDGNKRTGLLCALHQLQKANRVPSARQRAFENLAVDIARGTLLTSRRNKRGSKPENLTDDDVVQEIATFLKKKTRKPDTKARVLTYRQLERCLAPYQITMTSAHRSNFVDIHYRTTTTERRLLGPKRVTKAAKFQVAFPGWGREVSKNTIAEIRRRAQLRPEDGVSSAQFFEGADPVESLIAQYHGPLLRLKDR